MNVIETDIPEVKIIEPRVFSDTRGAFFESYNQRAFEAHLGTPIEFVQDNHSCSKRGVLRGLHYQVDRVQGKLVRVIAGSVFDVAVDIRRSSKTFGHWVGVTLSAQNRRQVWTPGGFAHGFLVLSEQVEFLYKTTDYYSPKDERCIRWDDEDIGIAWPLNGTPPLLSDKDAGGLDFRSAEHLP